MTLEEFREEYNMAPYSLEDFADGAAGIEDCDDLANAADAFLTAKFAFESMMDYYGVEVG